MNKPLDPRPVERVAKTETPSASYVLRRRYGRARPVITAASWLTVFNLLFQPVAAWAATYPWNVQMTGGPHDWNTLGNWNAGAGPVPVAGDTAAVNQNYTGALTIDISANAALQILNIGDSVTTTPGGTDFVTVSLGSTGGSSLTFQAAGGAAGAGTISSQGGANSIGNTLIMSAAAAATGLTITGSSGTLTISGDIQGASNVIIGGNNNATFPTGDTATQYTGVFRLPPTVADMNPGIVVFSGAKTFTGTLTISPLATLQVNSAQAMGSGSGRYIDVSGALGAGVLGDGFGMDAAALGKILTSSAGTLAITGNSAVNYDLATASLNLLMFGSTVLGSAASGGATYSGTLTPGTGGYLLGGGGVATKLILANGTISGATGVTVSGNGIVQFGDAAAGYTGAILANTTSGTAYIPNGIDLKTAASLTTTGTTPTAGGAVLLGPSGWVNGPGSVALNNGAIGWDANKTITGLPGAYSATTVTGTAGVTTVKLLHLGGTHSVSRMSQDGVYALQDDGSQAVELVKSGVQSTLDLSNAPSGGNTFSGGAHIASGTLLFSKDNQLGASGVKIVGNNTGILKLKAGAGAVSTSRILDPLDGGGGGGGSPLPGLAIDVTSGDTLTFTGDFEKNNGTARHIIVKTGTGILEILPTTLVSAGNVNSSWGIGVRGGTLRLNQLPYVSSTSGGTVGPLEFAANGTVDLLAPPSSPTGLTNFATSYGFSSIGVYNGATGTINVAANTILKNNGRSNATFITAGSTLIVAGQGYANGSEFRWGRGSSGSVANATNNGGTWDLRSIAFSFFSNQADAAMPSQTNFTLKFNDAKVDGLVPGATGENRFSLNGNLVINDLASASLSQIDRFIVTSTGNTSWRGTLEKIAANTVTFSRSGGSATVASGAVLKITAGTVTAGGTADPFWDTANTRGVAVENNGTFDVTTASKHIGALTGTGGTTVASGLTLTVDFDTTSAAYSGVISSAGNIAKAGSGTWILGTSTQTYTGTTTVSGGSLLVNSTLNTQTSAVTVGGNGTAGTPTLGGTGTINRPVVIAAAGTGVIGHLAPGAASGVTIGTLTVGSTLTLNGMGDFEVDKTGGTLTNDQVIGLTAAPDVTGATLNVTITGGGFAAGDKWKLFTWSGGGNITGTIAAAPANVPTGFKWKNSGTTGAPNYINPATGEIELEALPGGTVFILR